MKMAHPPMGYVTFKGLHKPEGQCAELTRQTAEALEHNQNLQMRFLLASKYDLEARLNALVNRVQMNGTTMHISPAMKEELLTGLQDALSQYQQEKGNVIIQVICQMPSGLSDQEMLAGVKDRILQHGQFSSVAKPQAL
ncbi:hypothetical protein FRB94_013081 [Tulasnella sp. JGI-2019a]|nr:hypothetical protein FRB94_013081 [Tulasnella sp. JGI-2019a]